MILYIDGGCSGNGQIDFSKREMRIAVTDASGNVLIEQTDQGGSNNIAELWALERALHLCVKSGVTAVEIRTDSQNNLSWGNGSKPGRDINNRALVLQLQGKIAEHRQKLALTLVWVPRDKNLAGQYLEMA